MNIEKIKSIFNENGIVKFKLYGLDYTIQKLDNRVCVFADLYVSKKSIYNDIDSLLQNYYIYGENIEFYDDRIRDIV